MDNISQILIHDIIEWDVINWSKLITFIDSNQIDLEGKAILEIGANNGGISLFCAYRGGKVVCSDLNGPTDKAKVLHQKYKLDKLITYESIDALNIPTKYNSFFDIIIFKSVLGGIGRNNNIENQRLCIDNLHRCLKKGGIIVFAENMKSTELHMFLRKRIKKMSWNYATENEILTLFSNFYLINKQYVGFLGCFGRNESQRELFGKVDSFLFDKLIPEKYRYIGIYLFQKP